MAGSTGRMEADRAVDGALLADVRVLDLSTVGPASRCSAWLADLGADVVKVMRPEGEGGIEPVWHAYGAGRGTRRVRVDLADPRGVEVFLALVCDADVVLDGYRPGVADRLGVGYDACRLANPRVVYAALTGYGQDGPYAQRAGHDLNYLAVGGFLAAQGRRPDGGPALPGATVADSAGGGMQAVIAVLAALLRRGTTGAGRFLDVSATEGVVSLMSLHLDEHLATGADVGPGSTLLLGRYACYDLYRCADDRWVAVGAIEARFFANLVRLLGLPEETASSQYVDERQPELREALREAFASRPRDAWVEVLADEDTCVTPVLTVEETTRDPHLRARAVFGTAHHPDHGEIEQVGPVLAGATGRGGRAAAPPADRTVARELLTGAGRGDVEQLLAEGVVG